MSALLAGEWVKLRVRWMPRIVVGILLLIMILIFWGIGTSPERSNLFFPTGLLTGLVLSASVSSFLWPVLAGSWAGSEYSWGTVRLILARRPSRIQFTLAGFIMVLIAVAIALIATLIVAGIAGAVVAALTGHPIIETPHASNFIVLLVKTGLATWYIAAFFVALAYAAGTIFRSNAAGIGIGIGVTIAQTIVTGIFTGLGGTWRSIAEHFPSVYTQALASRVAGPGLHGAFARVSNTTPGVGEAILGLAIYIVVLLALTLIVVTRRDVTA